MPGTAKTVWLPVGLGDFLREALRRARRYPQHFSERRRPLCQGAGGVPKREELDRATAVLDRDPPRIGPVQD